MLLINCKFNLILTWSASYVIFNAVNQAAAFAITDINVPVVILSIQDNANILP